MALETIEQLNFRLNLEQLLWDYREKLLEAYESNSDEYQYHGERAAKQVEIDVAVRRFIEDNCK